MAAYTQELLQLFSEPQGTSGCAVAFASHLRAGVCGLLVVLPSASASDPRLIWFHAQRHTVGSSIKSIHKRLCCDGGKKQTPAGPLSREERVATQQTPHLRVKHQLIGRDLIWLCFW